jgi:hypothetical protein
MQARLAVFAAVLTVGLAACTDQPRPTAPSAAPPAAAPLFAISDGAHSGNPHFFFLPPLQPSPRKNPNYERGGFDPTFSPVVKICDGRDLTNGECVTPLLKSGQPVVFNAVRGWDRLPDWVDPEQYHVLWQTKNYNLVVGHPYRILVKVGSTLLGFLDLVPVNGLLGALRVTAGGQDIGWLDDWVVPIRFRIEQGALCGGATDCAEASVGPEGKILLAASGLAGVAIPSGALSGTVHLTLSRRDSVPCLPPTQAQLGPCYEVVTDQPAGFALQAPATVGVCMVQAEPGMLGQLAKVEPQDPQQTVVLLDPATPEFLSCATALFPAQPVGGLTRAFSYIAPTMSPSAAQTVLIPSIGRGRAASTPLAPPPSPLWGDVRDATVWLVTGGLTGGATVGVAPLATAERVHVETSTGLPISETVGSLITARYLHTATRLSDGRVLVAGGVGPDLVNPLSSAELYNPVTRTFTATGSMIVPRALHTATLLPSGKVLIVGGTSGGPVPSLASAELYDPATGTFSLTGSMQSPRERHVATALPDGRVLITGGDKGVDPNNLEAPFVALASMEVFGSGGSASFVSAGSMLKARYHHTATYLPVASARSGNPIVLVVGGTDGTVVHNVPELVTVYLGAGGSSRPAHYPLAVPVQDHVARLTEGENVLIAGGTTDAGPHGEGYLASAVVQWYLDGGCSSLCEQTYQAPPFLQFPRSSATAVHILGNRLFVIGGVDRKNPAVFQASNEVWSF